jgi:hypothetical protein
MLASLRLGTSQSTLPAGMGRTTCQDADAARHDCDALAPTAQSGRMFRSTIKKLVCPGCGDIVGDAAYRRWPGNLVITSVDGYRINPFGAAAMRRIVERELVDARDDPARETAQVRLEFVISNITDPIYDLRCRRGHSTLRTTPQIIHAMVRTSGAWTPLEQT